jgi:CxxC motif-containing protein
MERRELTCIGCPIGCSLLIELGDDGELKVTGNKCKIGKSYAIKEFTNPTRVITTTAVVNNGEISQVSVKSEKDIEKGKIFKCLKALKNLTVDAPIAIGNVIYENIEGTGVNIIATKNVSKKQIEK